MKPGLESQSTGVLPQQRTRLVASSTYARPLCAPRTTSTSRIRYAGLKKCRPTSRSGWRSPPARAVSDSDDVFEASNVSAPTTASTAARSSRLAARSSAMASTTTTQPASSSSSAAVPTRAAAASAWSAEMVSRLASLRIPSRTALTACSAAPARTSRTSTGCPASAATWAIPAPIVPAPTDAHDVSA